MAQTDPWKQATSILARQAHRELLSYGDYQSNVLVSFIKNSLISSEFARNNLDRLRILQRSCRRNLRDFDGRLITGKLSGLLGLENDASLMLVHLYHGKESLESVTFYLCPLLRTLIFPFNCLGVF